MAKAAAKSTKPVRHNAGPEKLAPEASPWRVLTRTAFVLMIVLVVVRMTIVESLRNELQVVPGAVSAPATPGPATGLTLDLFFCIPALLILARRLVDASYRIRCGRAHLAMFLLAGWTLLSAFWAPDKFIAAIAAAHWAAAIVLLWAASQLVYQWRHMRIVAGVSFGLLLILLVQGYYYRFVDLPDLRQEWAKNRSQLLADRGTQAGSFENTQIDVNIMSGEVSGFSLSRNTYAALLVLLGIISAGVAVQRISDRDSPGWSIPIFVALAFAMLMLYRYVESKTAYATPFIGALLLTIVGKRRQWIAAHSRRLYFGGVACFLLGVAAVIGHGLRYGTLFQLSLTYRWQYWVGAARLFIHHPWLGVGWANFGNSYLAFRLPQAIEQPKDPHNFLIRAFVELGIVGGALMIAWMLRLWWELTQPVLCMADAAPAESNDSDHRHTMFLLIGLPVFAISISALVAIDWNQRYEWVILELFKRAMFLLTLLVGLGLVALRSFADQRLDDRPAPWILWSILVALGLFLIHNLIDFSLFEPGPLFLFALLAGSVLGVRLPECKGLDARMPVLMGSFIFAGVVWLVAAAAGAWNVALAEGLAHDAEDQAHANNRTAAVQKLIDASKLVPINPEYPFQAALLSPANTLMVREMLVKAANADPSSPRYRRMLAQFELRDKDPAHAFDDYATAASLDPNNMNLRIEYGDALAQANQLEHAKLQYQIALDVNDKLPPSEPQRLSEQKVAQLRAALVDKGLPK